MDMQEELNIKKEDAGNIRRYLFKIFKETTSVVNGIKKYIKKIHMSSDKQRRSFYAGFILGRWIERNEIAGAILSQSTKKRQKN